MAEKILNPTWNEDSPWGDGPSVGVDKNDPTQIPGFVRSEHPLLAPEDLEEKIAAAKGWD